MSSTGPCPPLNPLNPVNPVKRISFSLLRALRAENYLLDIPAGLCYMCSHNKVDQMMIIFANVGKTGSLAQSLLLIAHQKTLFLQIFYFNNNAKPLTNKVLREELRSSMSAFFCYFLLKVCICAELSTSTANDTCTSLTTHPPNQIQPTLLPRHPKKPPLYNSADLSYHSVPNNCLFLRPFFDTRR